MQLFLNTQEEAHKPANLMEDNQLIISNLENVLEVMNLILMPSTKQRSIWHWPISSHFNLVRDLWICEFTVLSVNKQMRSLCLMLKKKLMTDGEIVKED